MMKVKATTYLGRKTMLMIDHLLDKETETQRECQIPTVSEESIAAWTTRLMVSHSKGMLPFHCSLWSIPENPSLNLYIRNHLRANPKPPLTP